MNLHGQTYTASRYRHLWQGMGLIFAIGLMLSEHWHVRCQIDDAYISYRYALNLINGHGLVFNPGDYVEGISNILWTLMIAGFMAVGVEPTTAAHGLGLTFGSLTVVATFMASFHASRSAMIATLCALALIATKSFSTWVISGLETPLFCAVIAWMLYAHIRKWDTALLVLSCISTLVRPEGVLIGFIFLASKGYGAFKKSKSPHDFLYTPAARNMFIFAVFFGLQTVARFVYYGDWVPNTYHAKMGGIPLATGFNYFVDFLLDGTVALAIPIVIAMAHFREEKIFCFIFLLMSLYVIKAGGDAFQNGRFLIAYVPLILYTASLSTTISRTHFVASAGFIFLSICFSLLFHKDRSEVSHIKITTDNLSDTRTKTTNVCYENQLSFVADQVMRLGNHRPRITSIASMGIGMKGFLAPELHIIDLVGLTDRHIASSTRRIEGAFLWPGHQRTDAQYVIDSRPDFIDISERPARHPAPNGDTTANMVPPGILPLPAMLDLWQHPDLDKHYAYSRELGGYLRRDLMTPQ